VKLLRALVLTVLVVAACGGDDLPRKNVVQTIRILAARSESPYARPGETVKLAALVHDGRPPSATREPMRVYWLPDPCFLPAGGQYYDCFPALEAAYPTLGVDLDPRLSSGAETSLTVPGDALDRAGPPLPGGSSERVVTAYAFVVACGGHLERVPRRTGLGTNAPPFGCFGADRRPLGADDFVFGFTRVSVYAERRNAAPSIDAVRFRDVPVDRTKGITIDRCDLGFLESECDTSALDVAFADGTAELDVDNVAIDGRVGRETIFVDYFTTIGHFTDNRRIVLDPFSGRPENDDIQYEPPKSPGRGTIWVVLHDNRGGAAWVDFPIEVR
jgi:hypothetical protein